MKNKLPHVLIASCSLIGVVAVAVVDMARTSPGTIAQAHFNVEELDRGQNCNACHGSWIESMGEACLECHEVISEHLDLNVGLHGRLADVEADRCSTCHSEHHGQPYAMVNLQSFVHAGVGDPEKFDHGMVDFEMSGKHLELDCTKCHEFAEENLIPEGQYRYIGLSSDCASCHEDPHEGSMRQNCTNCHDQAGFETQHFDRHEQYFPLVGSHGDASCIECHAAEGSHSLDKQMAGTAPDDARECIACHDSPHSKSFVLGNALAVQLSGGATCVSCHDSLEHSFRGEDKEILPAQHAHSGFALDEPHAELDCTECHNAEHQEFEKRFPGRGPDDCIECHESPHGDQFITDNFSNNDCTVCHERTHFEPHAFSPQMHAEAALELTGAHVPLDCTECHGELNELGGRKFMGTPDRCEGCHSDAHDGFFGWDKRKVQSPPSGKCATCHTTSDFSEIADGSFKHRNWTGFELVGAHAQNRCESCHQPSAEEDEHGRTFGRISEHFGQVKDCASCHEDVHQGRFSERKKLIKFQGRESCLRCHGETSFRQLPHGFDHGKWTGFQLSGNHKNAECSACHAPIRPDLVASNGGRSWGPARGKECASCHEDPHVSQFMRDGETDCSRCHRAGGTFKNLSMRHNLDTRFALDESHAELECGACHKETKVGNRKVVRYRPLGITCADCHGVKENALRKTGRNR